MLRGLATETRSRTLVTGASAVGEKIKGFLCVPPVLAYGASVCGSVAELRKVSH